VQDSSAFRSLSLSIFGLFLILVLPLVVPLGTVLRLIAWGDAQLRIGGQRIGSKVLKAKYGASTGRSEKGACRSATSGMSH
jgi:hypothetical protein